LGRIAVENGKKLSFDETPEEEALEQEDGKEERKEKRERGRDP
jgi:hypothetical protein